MSDESDYLRRLIEDMVDAELRWGLEVGAVFGFQRGQNPRDIAIRIAGEVTRRLEAEGIEVRRR